jgi:hypothetical protein
VTDVQNDQEENVVEECERGRFLDAAFDARHYRRQGCIFVTRQIVVLFNSIGVAVVVEQGVEEAHGSRGYKGGGGGVWLHGDFVVCIGSLENISNAHRHFSDMVDLRLCTV